MTAELVVAQIPFLSDLVRAESLSEAILEVLDVSIRDPALTLRTDPGHGRVSRRSGSVSYLYIPARICTQRLNDGCYHRHLE